MKYFWVSRSVGQDREMFLEIRHHHVPLEDNYGRKNKANDAKIN